MTVSKVYLLRHGETPWTLSGQHTSITDLSLTENGILEAKKLGESLKGIKFDHLFCSPLKRVRETYQFTQIDTPAIYDPDLIEWNYGAYEGMTSEMIHKTAPDWTIFNGDPPGGESKRDVTLRADRFLQKVLALNGVVAILSSGHFSRVLGARWLEEDASFGSRLVLSTASKSILGFEHEKRAILLWNDTSHLCK